MRVHAPFFPNGETLGKPYDKYNLPEKLSKLLKHLADNGGVQGATSLRQMAVAFCWLMYLRRPHRVDNYWKIYLEASLPSWLPEGERKAILDPVPADMLDDIDDIFNVLGNSFTEFVDVDADMVFTTTELRNFPKRLTDAVKALDALQRGICDPILERAQRGEMTKLDYEILRSVMDSHTGDDGENPVKDVQNMVFQSTELEEFLMNPHGVRARSPSVSPSTGP